MPGQSPMGASVNTPKPTKKSGFNWKLASGIVMVFLVAVVGIAGVLIAQRQQADQTPVAPNAPQSVPQAKIPEVDSAKCSLSFEVKGTPPPTSPPPSTPPGNGNCVSKTAAKVSGNTTTPLAANAIVNKGDIIEFTITTSEPLDSYQTQLVTLSVTDTLSSQLQYVSTSTNIPETYYDSAKNTLLFKVGSSGIAYSSKANGRGQRVIKYRAQVKQTATGATITNNSVVLTDNKADSADSSCKVSLKLAAPPTGVAACTTKLAYKADGSAYGANGLAKRGDTITYKIVVHAPSETSGAVEVKDVLPTTLTYAGSPTVNGRAATSSQITASGQTLTFHLGTMGTTTATREYTLAYKATVKADAAVASFKNAVTVSTNGKAATSPAACTVNLQVAPVGIAVCKSKEAFTDYSGTKLSDKDVVQKGSTIAYKVTVSATETTSGSVVVVDKLPSTVEFVESKGNTLTNNNGTLTATIPTMGNTAANQTKVFEYKVKVKDTAPAGEFSNAVTVTTNNNTAQADSCQITLAVPYQCNTSCTTDAQCSSANSNFVCSSEAGNKCRMASNESSESCEGVSTSFSCNSSCGSNADCQSVNPDYVCAATSEGNRCRLSSAQSNTSCQVTTTATPTPTPVIGCNQSCTSNADCTNPSHICYTTGSGQQLCRLDTNPASESCTNPGGSTPEQPTLPQQLPQTGPKDWMNWLKAGLITLGVGATLLLLL